MSLDTPNDAEDAPLTTTGQDLEPPAGNPLPTEPNSGAEVDHGTANQEQRTAALRGRLDRISEGQACGWLFDPAAPNERLRVELLVDDRVMAQGSADQPRADLVNAGIGDGAYAFTLALDASLFDGQSHELTVRAADTGEPLLGSPILFCDDDEQRTAPLIRGHFDRVAEGIAYGWAFDPSHPEQRLEIGIYHRDQVIAQGTADQFRQDLLDAGIGDGAHAFEVPIALAQLNDTSAGFSARTMDHATWLPGNPLASGSNQTHERRLDQEPDQESNQELSRIRSRSPITSKSRIRRSPSLNPARHRPRMTCSEARCFALTIHRSHPSKIRAIPGSSFHHRRTPKPYRGSSCSPRTETWALAC